VQQVFTLPRAEIGAGFPLTFRYRVGLDNLPCSAIRVKLKVWAWKFRQKSAGTHTHTQAASGSTGGGGSHSHAFGTLAGQVTAGVTAVKSDAESPVVPLNAGASAGHTLLEADIPGHTHTNPDTGATAAPAGIVEGTTPNANLTITLDGAAYKAALGDGTEKVLVDEFLPVTGLTPGEHTLLFTCGAFGAVEAQLIVDF